MNNIVSSNDDKKGCKRPWWKSSGEKMKKNHGYYSDWVEEFSLSFSVSLLVWLAGCMALRRPKIPWQGPVRTKYANTLRQIGPQMYTGGPDTGQQPTFVLLCQGPLQSYSNDSVKNNFLCLQPTRSHTERIITRQSWKNISIKKPSKFIYNIWPVII